MENSSACSKALSKLDYKSLLDAVIYDYDYEELVKLNSQAPNLLEIPEFYKKDIKITEILNKLISLGKKIKVWEQNETGNTFKHIAINRDFHPDDGQNKFRLYISPENGSLYYIVYELIKRTVTQGGDIYLKYSREDRVDKILIYLKNKSDLFDKIRLLKDIKESYPILFQNMQKSIGWISESPFDGAYIAPENLVKRCNGAEFDSYTLLFSTMLKEMKMLLLYSLGDVNMPIEQLENYDRDTINNIFKKICIKVLGKYGVLLYQEGDNLRVFTSDEFPGVGMPLNEEISIDSKNNCLEIGRRKNGSIFRYYQVPISERIDLYRIDYSKLSYYDMDFNDHLKKKVYPDL